MKSALIHGPTCCGDKGGPQTSQGGTKEEQIREGSPGGSSGMDLGEHYSR